MQITKQDLEKFGCTAGCPGCRASLSGKSGQGHSEDCRLGLERALAGDLQAQTARRRENEYLEKVLEPEDRKRKSARQDPPPSDRRAEGGERGHDRRDEPQTCTSDEPQI